MNREGYTGAGAPPKMYTDDLSYQMFCFGREVFKPEKQKLSKMQQIVYDCISIDPSIKNAVKSLGMENGNIRSVRETLKRKGWL